jgi:hypothetical protein
MAERHIRRGRARWHGKRLEFIESDYRNQSAIEKALAKDRGYDARGILTLDEIRRLPCVQPTRLITLARKRSPKIAYPLAA